MSIIRSEKFSKFEKIHPLGMLLPFGVFAVGAYMQFNDGETFYASFNFCASVIILFSFLWLMIPKKLPRIVLAALMAFGTGIAIILSIKAHEYVYIAASGVILFGCVFACGKFVEQEYLENMKGKKGNNNNKKK